MKNKTSGFIIGLLLILGGVLFLLMNFGFIPDTQPLIWAGLFGLGGLGFLTYLVTSREHWWPIIPGLALLGIGALIALDALMPEVGETLGAGIFLGAVSLAFWIIYIFSGSKEWWAIIPGGTLLTLVLVVLFSEGFFAANISDDVTGGIFMLGLGLTFGLVYLLPSGDNRQRWALIPAAVLMLIGVIIAAAAVQMLALAAPIALILLGVYFVLRTLRRS
jgi:hypothetical protein